MGKDPCCLLGVGAINVYVPKQKQQKKTSPDQFLDS